MTGWSLQCSVLLACNANVRFVVSCKNVPVFCRYLTDNVATLPLGISTRLLTTNDTVMALLPLVEKPPWSRR